MRTKSLGVLLLTLLAVSLVPAADPEADAKRIEGKLMAPCCMANTVAVHESGASHRMRAEIRAMLAAGLTEQQILDRYVEQYGPQILSAPVAEGFSLTPYLFPLVFVLLAGVALALALRKWRRAARGDALPATPAAPTGPWAERLRRELDRLD